GFTGYQKDNDTGLYYANARYYDANTGTFLREDPWSGDINTPPSLHRYLYANSNPTVYIDPDGRAAYLFDGTGQDANDPSTINQTNIGKLRSLLDERRFYKHGVGTNDGWLGNKIGGLTGAGANYRMNEAYAEMVRNFNGIGKNGEAVEPDRTIDLFGFSRGAAIARIFANKISEKGIPDLSSRREQWAYGSGGVLRKEVVFDNYFKPEIRFMGIFDTVGSFGKPGDASEVGFDTSISPNVDVVRHAVAKDEMRSSFPLTSAIDPTNPNDPRIQERMFTGVHSDIGGSYSDDDSLSHDSLYWIYEEAKKAGVPVKPYPDKWLPIQPDDVPKLPTYETPQQAYAAIYLGKDVSYYDRVPKQGSRTIHDSRYWHSKTPREIIFRANKRPNGDDVPAWFYDPVMISMPEYEEYMRQNYDKPYWNVAEDYEAP
ncbi:MAG: DUF2235 domain-containing protein, partial [Xanthomonadales bacterium]|nr:DUF2235 domain-containing protein [Xanthomonadales bacterium]